MSADTGIKTEKNKYYCTIFTKKSNKPVVTFWVHTKDEEIVKYICILKWYAGTLDTKIFDNIQNFLTHEEKLKTWSREIEQKFNKKFRLLVSDK